MTAFLGFFINVALCYGIRDLSTLPGPTGLVFAQVSVDLTTLLSLEQGLIVRTRQILWDNLGKRGGLVLWSFVIIVQTITGAACQLSCVRSEYQGRNNIEHIN